MKTWMVVFCALSLVLGCDSLRGPPGPQGPAGLQGERGADGVTGSTGMNGAQGPAGVSPPSVAWRDPSGVVVGVGASLVFFHSMGGNWWPISARTGQVDVAALRDLAPVYESTDCSGPVLFAVPINLGGADLTPEPRQVFAVPSEGQVVGRTFHALADAAQPATKTVKSGDVADGCAAVGPSVVQVLVGTDAPRVSTPPVLFSSGPLHRVVSP